MPIGWSVLATLGLLGTPALRSVSQSFTLSTVGDVLHLESSDFRFIAGPIRDRLQNGRSVRIDFELEILVAPQGTPVATTRQGFNLSYDLWEERFAVTVIEDPVQSISHLTSLQAEAWCLDRLELPVSGLRAKGVGDDSPFWIRLVYRAADRDGPSDAADQPSSTLRRLIDLMSRRRADDASGAVVEAGPFRFP